MPFLLRAKFDRQDDKIEKPGPTGVGPGSSSLGGSGLEAEGYRNTASYLLQAFFTDAIEETGNAEADALR